jgi:hypothetical protein
MFLDSLPDATIQRGSLADMPGVARRWLDGAAPPEVEPKPAMGFDDYIPEPPPPEW